MTRRTVFASICAVFLVAALVLAACGGALDESGGEGAPADKGITSMDEVEGLAPMASGESYGQSAGADGSTGLAPSDFSFDRKIIQNSSLELQVEDVAESYQDVARIALEAGGFVLDSSASPTQDRPHADLTIRVPTTQYSSVLDLLRGLAIRVENETSTAQDVTEQYTDLEARLRSAQAVEIRYLDLLDRAQTIDDILKIQDRLSPIRLEIEQIQGQMNVMDTLSDMATISVSLSTEPPALVSSDSHPDPLKAAGDGWEASLLFLRAVGAGVFAAATFLWWLAPILVIVGIGFLVRYRMVRKSGGTS